MNKICRLCLKETTITFSIHYTDINGISISSFVKALIPELYLGLSLNPVVCKKCYEQLRQAYIFRLQCLRSENLIGIYIRETKHTENTIILDNVVDYWVKHYKYKPREIKGNLKEWFGNKKDDSGKPIILNQNTNISDLTENASDTEDDVFSEEPSTSTQYIQKDNIYILQKEKTTSESDSQKKDGHAAVDDTVIVTKIPFNTVKIQSNVPSTSGNSDKEDCRTKSKLNTEKEINKEVNRKEICIMDIIHKIDERMAKSKTVESEIPVNIIEKVGPIRTYIKKPKNVEEEADNTNSQETSTLKVVNAKKRIHLEPYDVNDKETACLIEELQKTENLAKLGITANATDEVYVLRKFLNPSDNVVNFALVPKRISENDRNKQIDVLLNVFNQGKTSVKAAGKSGEKSDHNEDLPKVINNKMLNQNASGMTENVEFDSNYTQKGLTCCKVKKYYRKLPPGSHSIKFSKEGNKDNSSISENTGNLDPSAQKSDKESLDSITLSLDSKKADEAIKSADPTSENKSRSKPMPVIRVRPVSTLQKVRTLNHELWPQKPGFLKLDFEPIKNLNETSPKVINSESASSELVNSNKTPTARILKTYLKRGTIKTKGNAFKPIVLRTINPATLKASGTRHRLIKPKPAPPATTDSSREDSVSEDVIDIKEEPLDYAESNTLDTANFGSNGNNPVTSAESDGEKTRSASETSFMDTLSNQNEILQSIVANIPELGDDQYDEPEYIHINNVSYSDLAKLVDESKKHRDELGKAPTETPDPVNIKTEVKVQKPESSVDGSPASYSVPRYCFVPGCKNNSKSCPEKMFVRVPTDKEEQRAWFDVVGRRFFPLSSISYFCCEDHFNVKEDMENYSEYKKLGGFRNPELTFSKNSLATISELLDSSLICKETPAQSIGETSEPTQQIQPHIEVSEAGTNEDQTQVASNRVRCCFVPGCKSNSRTCPTKRFTDLPSDKEMQKELFRAFRMRYYPIQDYQLFSYCEDHSEINKDIENYLKYRIFDGTVMKKGIMPHKLIRAANPGSIFNNDLVLETKSSNDNVVSIEPSVDSIDETRLKINKSSGDLELPYKIDKDEPKTLDDEPIGKTNEFTEGIQPYVEISDVCEDSEISNKVEQEELKISDDDNDDALLESDKIQTFTEISGTCPKGKNATEASSHIKYCFVPGCQSNSKKYPNKIFASLPTDKETLKRWFETVERQDIPFQDYHLYFCCEDHFDIETDMEKYTEYKKFGGTALIKTGVIPHKRLRLEELDSDNVISEPEGSDDDVVIIEPIGETQLNINEPPFKVGDKTSRTKNSRITSVKKCFVRSCNNTSKLNPTKIFVNVPANKKVRKHWFDVVGRSYALSKGAYTCCEDHFDMEKDMENYMSYTSFGGTLIVKEGVIPHKLLNPGEENLDQTENQFKLIRTRFKYCFVPGCKSNSSLYSSKIFVNVPTDTEIQKRWFNAVSRRAANVKTKYVCCEDHFDTELIKQYKNFGDIILRNEWFLPRLAKPESSTNIEAIKKKAPQPTSTTKFCFVPNCTNNSETDNSQLFMKVPEESEEQQFWFQAVGRKFSGVLANLWCCDDCGKKLREKGIFRHKACYARRKHCFVSNCKNNSISNHSKIFIKVPPEAEEQKRWFKAAGKPYSGVTSNLWFCEDHFNLKKDVAYDSIFHTFLSSSILHKGVVPHKCLPPATKIEIISKRCFVPNCNNNSEDCPDQIFMALPSRRDVRKKWFEAVGKKCEPSCNLVYCCEEHYNILKDIDAYLNRVPSDGSILERKEVLPGKSVADSAPPSKKLKKK